MTPDPDRLQTLLDAALKLPGPVDRAGFLDRQCGDDPGLRRRLDELLAGSGRTITLGDSAESGDTIEVPETGPETGANRPDPALGTLIAGRYRVRQAIGEGGMGSVYLAQQVQPVKRHVALKLIRPGMDSRDVLARFESERQALAMMDHPHIAKVLDAGTIDQGRPFFVMELVKGVPLTEYCDRHRLGLPERLALFGQVCGAVQHAHQKGIIHRDLKPSNILVEDHDGKPVPKVIDFGLAKATVGMKLSDQSLLTAFGSVAGTPLYMAPEQASFGPLDVDTRADIYALGVILYELLTGSTPIRRESIRRAAIDEVLRVIREDEPPTPSSRIGSSDTLPSLAANRHTEPARLGRFVRGDLDWIAMKALAKERSRRYESASALAQDIERFISHEPVSAGPPTASYRLRKFVRRHRGRVVAASLILLAMIGGIVGTTIGLIEARRQGAEARRLERIAVASADQEQDARRAEAEQRLKAESRLAQIAKANEVLGSIFIDLNPKAAERENKPLSAVLGERLDRASALIEGEAIGDPMTVARMQVTLGRSQLGLGHADKAIGLLTRARATYAAALGRDAVETIDASTYLASGYQAVGQLDRAIPLLEETLALVRARLGEGHADTLTTKNNLGFVYRVAGRLDRAIPLLEETEPIARAKLGVDHPTTLDCMGNLAEGYRDIGRFDRAIALYEEALALRKAKLGPDHPDTLLLMNNLALAYKDAGRFDRMTPLQEETMALIRAKLGPDHPSTLLAKTNLALAYIATGKLDRALPMLEEALALQKVSLGADHPNTLSNMSNLASGYHSAGRFDRSIPLFEETLPLLKAKLGVDHPKTLNCMNNLGLSYRAAGRLDRALPILEETLAIEKVKLGADHPHTIDLISDLAFACQLADRPGRATALSRELVDLQGRKAGTNSPQYTGALSLLGSSLVLGGEFAEAEPVLRQCLTIRRAKAPDDWRTFSIESTLGAALLGQGKSAEAEGPLRDGYAGMEQRADKIPVEAKVRLLVALDRLIKLAEATGKPDEAEAWRDKKAGLAKSQ